MAKTKTTSTEQLKKCPFCSFKSRSHSEWKDHMAECYETRHFCRRCDYSTDKKVNYIRHLKRNHPDEVEKGQGSQQSDNAEGIKSSEDSLSRDIHEDDSSDEEEWLSQEPDITIDEEPCTSNKEPRDCIATSGPSPCEKAVDPTVRKRTQPMPVYTPDRCKTPRLDDKTNDSTCKVADKAVQTDPVVYTKSIKTTTIVREHGRKTITVKREKML